MKAKFSSLVENLFYNFTLAEIKIENAKQKDLSHNTMLYRKIICKESGKHTISSIAKLLDVATTAVTQKVNELEKKGYVAREQSQEDKRISYLVGIEQKCPCGESFLERDTYVFDALSQEYSEESLQLFMKMLEKTNEHYEAYDKQIGGSDGI